MGPIKVIRDCEAIQIPSGEKQTIAAGTEVRITQSLGGTYTVMTEWGALLRIEGKDADAIGKPKAEGPKLDHSSPLDAPSIEKLVWDQLRTCFDPEIPINMVDLGLVYECKATALSEGGNKVEVKFTLTAPGCGMGDVLKRDIESKILTIPGVRELDVQVVFDPPWDRSMMSEAAKLQLGLV